MYVSLLSCIALILLFLPPVVSIISSPGALTRQVGQDVVFMFNASKRIDAFNWGIRDGNTNNLKQGLIYYDTQVGMKLDDKINSSSYAGRVSFVGDLSKNQAWFKITNLNINDTNQYTAKIFTQGSSGYTNLHVRLTVIMPPPTTTAFFQTSTIPTDTVSVESTTTIATTKKTLTSEAPITKKYSHNEPVASDSKCTSIIATSVTINVLLTLVVVILVVYILMRKRNTEGRANARLTNVKDEELGVYENAHQIEGASFDSKSKATQPSNTGKEIYETIIHENESKNIKSHRREKDTVGTSLDPVVVNKSHSAMQPQQHYQELKRANKKPSALYESLEQRNMQGNYGNKILKEPATYEPLQPNKAGTEYQSLNNPIQSYPNSAESKV